jgi:hypothetical protein
MGNATTFRLQVVSDQTFQNQIVYLSGIRYEARRFIKCRLVYVGGLGEMSDCWIAPDTEWEFGGLAATVVETLQQYGFRFFFGKESPADGRILLEGPVSVVDENA